MRALVQGAVNDHRTRILLDTGANDSAITDTFAKKLRLRDIPDHGRSTDIQGISEGKVSTTRRALVKITLGWEMVYEFKMWIMAHVDVVLGTDFTIPAGIRLDLFHGAAQLPNEVCIPLTETKNVVDSMEYSAHVNAGPSEALDVPGHESREEGHPISDKVSTTAHQIDERLGTDGGYVRLDSKKYKDWQVLAYENCRDRQFFKRECELYEQWLATQPPSVERRAYPTLAGVMKRSPEDALDVSADRLTSSGVTDEDAFEIRFSADSSDSGSGSDGDDSDANEESAGCSQELQGITKVVNTSPRVQLVPGSEGDLSSTAIGETKIASDAKCRDSGSSASYIATREWEGRTAGREEVHASLKEMQTRASVRVESEVEAKSTKEAVLDKTYMLVARVLTTEENEAVGDPGVDHYEHPANKIGLEDYAKELAFLPDFTEDSNTTINYEAPNQERLVATLKKNEQILIASGNALPPPAYGVVCDIDTQEHTPIKQRAPRVPVHNLGKLPWASPIVIVMKRNGLDIRLCIDYKMVNVITAIMEYAMPLVDDLLTDLEIYLWFRSLDAASSFWAIMMTLRARKESAFVCALGHFEWLRMPFGLKNAPMIYQRMIDNALWGFVQPKGGWCKYSELMSTAEEKAKERRTTSIDGSFQTKFKADREASVDTDPVIQLVNDPIADMFQNGEPDESTLVPVFGRRSFVDDICFGGEDFDGCLATLDRLLAQFAECRISISFTKSIFCQTKVDFLSYEVSPEGIRANPKKLAAITELSFPTTKRGMQSFLGALNYYSRFIQDFAVYGAALYQLKEEDFGPSGDLSVARRAFAALQAKVIEAPILKHFDRAKDVHVMLFANEWALSTTLMQEHEGKLHPIRFLGRVLKDSEMNYHPAEKEVLALLLLLKTCYTQLAGKTLRVYTRFSTLAWVHKSKSLLGRAVQFAVLLLPWHLIVERVKEKDVVFAQLLQSTITNFVDLEETLAPLAPLSKCSPSIRMDPSLLYAHYHATTGDSSYQWKIVIAANAYLPSTTVNLAEYTGMNNGVKAALSHGAEELVIVGDSRLAIQQSLGVILCRKESLIALLNTHKELPVKLRSVKYLHVVREYNATADSLATEALESKVSRVILAETGESELVTLNRIQEVIYELCEDSAEVGSRQEEHCVHVPTGNARSSPKTFENFVSDDNSSKLNTTGTITVMTRRQAKAKHVRFADECSEQTPKGQEQGKECDGVVNEHSLNDISQDQPSSNKRTSAPDAEDVDRIEIQRERRRRIAKAQDEEQKWPNLKKVLRGEAERMSYKEARNAWKYADRFVLSDDGVLHYLVLQNCHNSLEGGHQGVVKTFDRVKSDYYWIGLYADVEKHVKSCLDCSSSKSRPQLRGYSPGNVLAERPFQIVSMDFVIPLPKTRRDNTALLLFQCSFTGFVIAKTMSDTSALSVARVFEECVYRRFGAPSLIRHNRDPRFMSEVFQAFTEMMQSRSRATLSYRPQANGQQERSVKSVMTSVRVSAEDPLQQDWDEIAERLVFAINTSQDTTRKETPFYLVHGWDAQSTLRAMSSSLGRGSNRRSVALAWRREVNRQHEIAMTMAKDYQAAEKERRAKEHDEALSRLEKTAVPEPRGNGRSLGSPEVLSVPNDAVECPPRSLFEMGGRVWLYMERVKPGLTKKLAHRWHGPFRIKRKVEEFAYELELPDKSGYRFYPVVHVSRLKAVNEYPSRPKTRLSQDVTEDIRFDFDEELLPEDSWEPDHLAGEYGVEAILDDRMPLSTSTERAVREFKVKWVGYEEPTWEPSSNLSCGGLLYDYLRAKKSERRLQMVQVADED
ncbi:hypothetical protein F442_21578 [Phytophthora nicotianae P10297]|uniref:Uncharacterized protein n=1 Tax=Phytophthora nicotianae P10297 TaxID=1317064 RepID=W2Y3Q0_PHYNI|nr:hypothetical protein F442_21578 [Phytophthora nicotianae P10297]